MKYLVAFAIVISCSCIHNNTHAQQVTGHWYGVGRVMVPGEHNSYMSELILKQKGRIVTGELQYYFRDSLFKVPVNGTFNSNTRQLNLKPIPFIYYLSTSTRNGIDCILTGNFTLIVNRTESVLNGAFESDAAHKYTNPAIQFKFRYSTDTAVSNKNIIIEETEEESMMVPDVDSTVATPDPVQEESPIIDPALRNREKIYTREIEISSNSIRLELYDNGSVDNDSVAVYLNNRIIIPPAQLTHKAIRKTITLDSTVDVNELSMLAINLGMVPPNTAALILYDGDKRHELILTSDMNRTATIKLKRKKKEE